MSFRKVSPSIYLTQSNASQILSPGSKVLIVLTVLF